MNAWRLASVYDALFFLTLVKKLIDFDSEFIVF